MDRLKYNEVGIAGKFRMIHIAHKELVLRAIGLGKKVHIFIVDVPEYKRYSTIDALITSFKEICHNVGFYSFEIHVIHEELSGRAWDEAVLAFAPSIEVMFDSKEVYDNILVSNAYVELSHSKEISVSAIEKHPYSIQNSPLIASEFWPNMLFHVVVVGDSGSGKTTLVKKLASCFQTGSSDHLMSFEQLTQFRKAFFYDDLKMCDIKKLPHEKTLIIGLYAHQSVAQDEQMLSLLSNDFDENFTKAMIWIQKFMQ